MTRLRAGALSLLLLVSACTVPTRPPAPSPSASSAAAPAPSSALASPGNGSPVATVAASPAATAATWRVGTCTVDRLGVPAGCLGLFGLAAQGTPAQGAEADRLAGRPFDLRYRFHDLASTFPDAEERPLLAAGRLLHVSIASRLFNGGAVRYSEVAAGTHDAGLAAQARGIAAAGVPVFVTFEQEGNQADKAGAKGTAAEYRQAWRHVHDVFVAAGATNAVWVWVMMSGLDRAPMAGELWPGNDVVDWLSWNVYNRGGCKDKGVTAKEFVSFADRFGGFHQWLLDHGPGLGIDTGKPIMVSEAGSVTYPDDPQRTAQWYADIPATMRRVPALRAVTLWSGVDEQGARPCNYRFQDDPTVAAGVASAATALAAPR